MNILYLGPYKQLDDIGELSRLYLESLKKNSNVTAGCVYTSFDTQTIKSYDDPFLKHQTKYDILIQHLPISKLVISQKFKKNIAIPIIGNELCSHRDREVLNFFDKVFVDSPYAKNHLDKILKKSTIFIRPTINVDQINQTKNQVFNLGIHDHMKKFYMICDYKDNIDLIHSAIVEFVHVLKRQPNISLVLFLAGMRGDASQRLESYIKKTYELARIKSSNIHIVIVDITADPKSLIISHNSGHIFLNINDNSKNSLNLWYAKTLDKKIIDITDLETSLSCVRNEKYSHDMFHIPAPNSISEAIQSILLDKKTGNANQFNNSKKIDDKILC